MSCGLKEYVHRLSLCGRQGESGIITACIIYEEDIIRTVYVSLSSIDINVSLKRVTTCRRNRAAIYCDVEYRTVIRRDSGVVGIRHTHRNSGVGRVR